MLQYTIGAPENGSFNGGLWLGFSNNDLQPNESPEMYNYLADDSGLTKCPGCAKDNATQIGSGTGTTGLSRFYDGTNYHTLAKIGTGVYKVKATGASEYVIEAVTAGDTNGQLADTGESGLDSAYALLTELMADYIAHCAVGTLIHTLLTELRADYIAHCAVVGGSPCHSAADVVNNDPTAIASTSVADMITAANSLKTHYNAHDTETGVYHPAAGTAHQIAAAAATDFATLITLVNELRTDYEAHRIDDDCHGLIDTTNAIAAAAVSTTGNVHATADTVNNAPTAIASINVADMITAANSLKTKYNAHDTESGTYHIAAGTAHQVSADAAATLATLITLINEIKSDYEAHRIDAAAHAAADSANAIAAADAAINPNAVSWTISGTTSLNTNGGILYWSLTNATSTRTMSVYKNSDGAAGNLVAQGSRTNDGLITLTAQNASGITGSVTVAYIADDTTLAANTLTPGVLVAATVINFTDWLGYCFFADGVNLYSFSTGNATATTWLDEDGASTGAWTVTPKPRCPVLWKEHLWFLDATYPTRVGFTVRGYSDRVYEDTINAGTYGSWLSCDKDDGQELVGLVRMPMDDCLMAFKGRKTYLITGDFDSTEDTLAVIPGPPAGAFSQGAIDAGPDGFVRWCGLQGIWEFRRDVGAQRISRPIDYELGGVSATNQAKIRLKHHTYQGRLYLVVSYASTGSTNNRCFIADLARRGRFDQPCWVQRRSWSAADLCVHEDGTLHAGWSDTGYVKKLFYGANDDIAAIACLWKTKYFTWVHGVVHALRYLRFGGRTSGSKITVTYLGDVASGASGTIDIEQPLTGVALGTFLLGTSVLVGVEDLLTYGTYDDRPRGGQNFRELQVSFSESSTNSHQIDFLEVTAAPVRRDV